MPVGNQRDLRTVAHLVSWRDGRDDMSSFTWD